MHDCTLDYICLNEMPAHAGADQSTVRRRESFSLGMALQQSAQKGVSVAVVYLVSNEP
jgi:hypothetical protein